MIKKISIKKLIQYPNKNKYKSKIIKNKYLKKIKNKYKIKSDNRISLLNLLKILMPGMILINFKK
jgi:hypothetical protein